MLVMLGFMSSRVIYVIGRAILRLCVKFISDCELLCLELYVRSLILVNEISSFRKKLTLVNEISSFIRKKWRSGFQVCGFTSMIVIFFCLLINCDYDIM